MPGGHQQRRSPAGTSLFGHRFTAVAAAGNVPMGMLLRSVGAVQAGRGLGTADYEIALVRADEYNLDWWFRCVEDGSVFTWR